MNSLDRRLERLESQHDSNLITRHEIDIMDAYMHRTLCQLFEGAEPPTKRPPDYSMVGQPHNYDLPADVKAALESLTEGNL